MTVAHPRIAFERYEIEIAPKIVRMAMAGAVNNVTRFIDARSDLMDRFAPRQGRSRIAVPHGKHIARPD